MSGGRMGKGRNEGKSGELSATSARSYESALRGLDGFLQGMPATDESVAGCKASFRFAEAYPKTTPYY